MEDFNLYQNLYNENYTDARKSDLIQKVIENKTKQMLSEKSEAIKMANGGLVEDKIYTPYEFLHELLPKVYGRPYVVSDEVGKQYNERIEQEQKELDDYLNSKLAEYGVNSLYKIDNKPLIEEIEIRRRKLISDKSFITETELIAYLFCHPELNTEHYIKEMPIFDIPFLVSQAVIMVDYDKQNDSYSYVYVHEYLSGNLYKKLTRLREKKDRLMKLGILTEEQFILQESALKNNMPIQAKITKDLDTCLFILPNSKFGKEFFISPEEVMDIQMSYSQNFINTFKQWTKTELDLAIITKSRTLAEVHKYFSDLSPRGNDDERVYSDRRKKAFFDGKMILMEFMNKGLTNDCKNRLEFTWNETYNFYTEPKYYKLPVACHLSNKFKNGKVFIPNETQIQSIQFAKSVGSGLLAHGVGVGKTASSILNVSYAIDNNLCKKPIFIVPNATYEKWKIEMFGINKTIYEVTYFQNEVSLSLTFDIKNKANKFAKSVNGKVKIINEKIYGHIQHITNYVELYNLNEEIVSNIKEYTNDEQLQIKNISELFEYLKSLPKDYQFDNNEINSNIRKTYDDFEIDNLRKDYNDFVNDKFDTWWKFQKNKKAQDYNYFQGKDWYIENVIKMTLKEYFEKGIKKYREELPYILGTLKTFPDKTIFLATYEALEHLGLVMQDNMELRDNNSLYGSLFTDISQGDFVSNANYQATRNLAVLWRDSVYGKKNTKIDITQLGFDYAVFDESHFLKKVIVDCKGIPTGGSRKGKGDSSTSMRETRKYNFGSGTYPSTLGLIGYFLTHFVQDTNNGNNVLHLTATPFTNKPAEIYSMLSLTNRKMLRESDFLYMEQFFDVFMDISFELIFGNTGVMRKESLLGYRNLPQLRNLIYSMMDYKSGEDANIKRPEKILFPSYEYNRETTLPETPTQDALFKQIKDYQRGRIEYTELCADAVEDIDVDELSEQELLDYVDENGTDAQKEKYEALEKPLNEKEFDALKKAVKKIYDDFVELKEEDLSEGSERDAFRVVKGLTTLKAVTLSPYLSACQKEAGIEPTYKQYIESSPKLIYTLNCIKSIHDYELENNLLKSGCVIYMNLGVKPSFKKSNGEKFQWSQGGFEKIKQYLISQMGYSADEVSIVSGGLSPIQKEREKNKFLSGKSSVLIGSSTISTGVDLQNNASALFLCSFDWNPTDNEQIAGRIHRQGNRFEKIRVVYPMVMNSADPNIFQQLYEKTLRIKNIWDRNDKGNTLDLKDFDVNSLRKGILDEPEDLTVYWREEQTEELETLDIVLDRRLTDLRNARADKDTLDLYTPQMKGMIVVIDAYRKDKAREEAKAKMDEKIGSAQDEYNEKVAELKEQLDNDFSFAPKWTAEMTKAKDKLDKVKDKAKEDVYDFEKDPDGRYRYLTYDEIGDGDDLFKMVGRYITNSDSFYSKFNYQTELYEIYNSWLKDKFPRFQEGKYDMSKPEEEDIKNYVDYQSPSPQNNANKWKGAYRGFGKIKENLQILGIEFDDIPQAIDSINEEKEKIKQELENVKQQLPIKLQEFTLAKEERMVVQTTIEQRVDEFSSLNYMLQETIPTFAIDKAKTVEIPLEKLPIKPSKKDIEKVIEEAIIDEEVEEEIVDTTNLIENLKNGLIVRFNFEVKKNLNKILDLLFVNGQYIMYSSFENSNGDVIDDAEEIISQSEVIDFYITHNDKISKEFYDDAKAEEEIIFSEKDEVFKVQMYKDLIEGYELLLEDETDQEKIKMYNDLIEGYQLVLEI